MSDRVYRSTLTAKRIAGPKWVLLVCVALAAAADVLVLGALGAAGCAGVYFIGPAVLLAADVLLIVCAVFSNFRFRYSVLWVVLYLCIAAAMTVMTVLLNMETQPVVFTRVAEGAWVALHALALVAVLISSLYAAKQKAFSRGAAAAVVAALLLLCTGAYFAFVLGNGYFGQGAGVRPLTYVYNEEEGCYEATGVVSGSGDTVVVPETFDGKPVGALDCGVFAAEGVSVVRFENGDLTLKNTDALSLVAKDLTVYAGREQIDELRVLFYDLAENAKNPENALRVANGFRPLGLEENEVYVTFAYTADSYAIAEGRILPTWIGRAGTAFDLSAYEEEYPYLAHADKTSDEDLHWGYTQFGGWILGTPGDNELASMLGKPVESSVGGVTVGFEKVCRVKISEDNDALYETADSYKYSSAGGETLSFRYAVPSTAQALLDGLPVREGFTVTWEYGGQELTDLEEILQRENGIVAVAPVWELRAPEVAVTSESGLSVVYGAEVVLEAEVRLPVAGLAAAYTWEAPEGKEGSGAAYDLGVPVPAKSGEYTVTVTLSGGTLRTSLTSNATVSVQLKVAKKPLNFEWTLPEGQDLTYSAEDKTIGCEAAAGQAVGSDELTYSLSRDSVRDAGDYTITLMLTGDTAEKYAIASGHASRSFTIQPYEAEVQWGAASFTYDGEEHLPTATAQGVGSDGALTLTVSGGETEAGGYTARASVEDGNYTLQNPERSFTIARRQIIVSAWSGSSFTYNGEAQHPEAEMLGNVVAADEADVLAALTYTGYGTNAGSYTVRAQLAASGVSANYAFAEEQTRGYTIGKLGVTLVWQDPTKLTYNGSAQGVEVVGAQGLSGSLLTELLNDLSYTGEQTVAGNDYTMTASLGEESNFTVAGGGSHAYSVAKRQITVSRWNGSSFTYNGRAQHPEASALWDVVEKDADAVLAALTYTGYGTDAGSYTVRAQLAASGVSANYAFAAEQTRGYTIEKQGVTLVWQTGRTFTYDGTEKSIKVSGASEISGSLLEELLADLRYDGAETEAGTHTMTASLGEDSNFTILANNTCTYTIEPQTVTLSWQDATAEFAYDGSAKTPVAKASETGAQLVYEYRDESGGLLGSAPSEVGTYTVTVRVADGNYSAEPISMRFSIVGGGEEEV